MFRNVLAIVLLAVIISAMFAGCDGGKTRVITGVLEDWDEANMTVIVDGISYKVAAGGEKWFEQGEKGKTYKFTIDEFGSVIAVNKV